MVARELLDPDSSMWHWIASDLHFYRTKHALSLSQLGERIDLSRGAVSNLEAARPGFRLQEKQAKRLDEMWSLNGRFERMVRYAKRGHDPDWFGSYTEHEQQAMAIKAFGLALVPGLLQTAEYARALFIAGRISDIEQAITLRMSRQSVLTRDDPPELWVLLAEYVIETPIGGPEVMRGQLERLLNACDSPHVILRVVPKTAGAHVGLDGAFNLVYTPKYKAAYLEAVGGGRLSDDKHEVERFALRFDRIGADALPQDVSRQRIVQAMESMS